MARCVLPQKHTWTDRIARTPSCAHAPSFSPARHCETALEIRRALGHWTCFLARHRGKQHGGRGWARHPAPGSRFGSFPPFSSGSLAGPVHLCHSMPLTANTVPVTYSIPESRLCSLSPMQRCAVCWVSRPLVYFSEAGSRQSKCFHLQDSPHFSNGGAIPASGGVAAASECITCRG